LSIIRPNPFCTSEARANHRNQKFSPTKGAAFIFFRERQCIANTRKRSAPKRRCDTPINCNSIFTSFSQQPAQHNYTVRLNHFFMISQLSFCSIYIRVHKTWTWTRIIQTWSSRKELHWTWKPARNMWVTVRSTPFQNETFHEISGKKMISTIQPSNVENKLKTDINSELIIIADCWMNRASSTHVYEHRKRAPHEIIICPRHYFYVPARYGWFS